MHEVTGSTLGRWFDAYAASLCLYARQWLDRSAAEDVVQDVFLRLAAQPQPPANVKAWLFRSVRNAAINQALSQRRRRVREECIAGRRQDWIEADLATGIDAASAQAALEKLPPEQREVIILRTWAGLTLQEISELLNAPISTLFSRYEAGLAAIKRIMEQPCNTNPT